MKVSACGYSVLSPQSSVFSFQWALCTLAGLITEDWRLITEDCGLNDFALGAIRWVSG